jgi:hypothetical protein
MTPLIIASTIAVPFNFVGNVVFDERIDLSPSKNAYREGILRTYGAMPERCVPQTSTGPCVDTRPVPLKDSQLLAEEMDNLHCLWKTGVNCDMEKEQHLQFKIPLWIINTTTDYTKTPPFFDFAGKKDIEAAAFEITPLGMRSRFYGNMRGLRELPMWRVPRLTLNEAVAASSAYADYQQREMRLLRVPMTGFFNSTGLNWGTDFNNPHVSKERVQFTHRLLPFPFYYFHRYDQDEHAVSIHLSDGGQSENLGLWALARRGVRDIVVVDGGYDRDGYLSDLCRIAYMLRERGLELRFPALKNFTPSGCWSDSYCYKTLSNESDHYNNIFAWRYPVVEGCIVRPDPNDYRKCEMSSEPLRHGPCDDEAIKDVAPKSFECPKGSEPGLVSRVWLIKLAIDISKDNGPTPLREADLHCGPILDGKSDTLESCKKTLDQPPGGRGVPLPIELAAFFHDYALHEVESDGYPAFPQHNTAWITLKSDSFLYGGYRELGRWLAHHLTISDGRIWSIDDSKK